jgi:hypothetical protein
MADVQVKSNTSEVAANMRAAAVDALQVVAREIAEADIGFRESLRGPAPGAGRTPFRTGNLQSTGRTTMSGLSWSYVNDARPYSPSNAEQGDRVRIHGGRPSYASFAHFAGEPDGQFAQDAGDLFREAFGPELEDRAERALLELLR